MTTPWRGTSANDLHRGGVRGGDSKNGDLLLVTSGGHQGAFHVYPNLVSQPPQRGDPQKPLDGARINSSLGSRDSTLSPAPEDQFALRVWMRDIMLGWKEGSVNMRQARRNEKRMVEVLLLRFPTGGKTRRRVNAAFWNSRWTWTQAKSTRS